MFNRRHFLHFLPSVRLEEGKNRRICSGGPRFPYFAAAALMALSASSCAVRSAVFTSISPVTIAGI